MILTDSEETNIRVISEALVEAEDVHSGSHSEDDLWVESSTDLTRQLLVSQVLQKTRSKGTRNSI